MLAGMGFPSDRLEGNLHAALLGIGHQLTEYVEALRTVGHTVEIERDRAMWQPAKGLQLALLLAIRKSLDEPHVHANQTTIEVGKICHDAKRHRLRFARTTIVRRHSGLDDWHAVQRSGFSRLKRHLHILGARPQSAALVQRAEPP